MVKTGWIIEGETITRPQKLNFDDEIENNIQNGLKKPKILSEELIARLLELTNGQRTDYGENIMSDGPICFYKAERYRIGLLREIFKPFIKGSYGDSADSDPDDVEGDEVVISQDFVNEKRRIYERDTVIKEKKEQNPTEANKSNILNSVNYVDIPAHIDKDMVPIGRINLNKNTGLKVYPNEAIGDHDIMGLSSDLEYFKNILTLLDGPILKSLMIVNTLFINYTDRIASFYAAT